MKLCIANYQNKSTKAIASHTPSSVLSIVCSDLAWIEKHFGDKRISVHIDHTWITLSVDPHGRARWSKVMKDGRRSISFTHHTDLKHFGTTYIPINHITLNDGAVMFMVPSEEELVTPIKRRKKTPPPPIVISLSDAVRAVNQHLKRCPDATAEIRDRELVVLIEYR